MESRDSIKRKFLIISAVLFMVIFAGGSAAFIFSMRQIILSNEENALRTLTEFKRIKLESALSGEISLILKMTDSPLIKLYFIDPHNSDLARMAFDEIEGYRQALAAKSIFWVNDQDKGFYTDGAYVYTVDPDDPGSYWYHMTLYETEMYNLNINYNDELKKTRLWINAPAFDANRNPIGMMGTGIDLAAFIDSLYEGYLGRSELYFFNAAGEITGARNTDLVANKITLDKELGQTGADILAAVQNAAEEIQLLGTRNGVVAVGPVPALDWHIAAVLSLTFADYFKTPMTALFLAMLAAIVLIACIYQFFIRRFLKPLAGMMETLNRLENSDLSVSIESISRDELGELMRAMGNFLEKLKTSFVSFNQSAVMVSTAVFDLSASAKEITTTANEQSASVAEIVSTVESSKDLSEQVAVKTTEVADLAARTRELSQWGVELRDASEDMMLDIRDQNLKIIDEIKNLADMLSRIDESVQLIDTITDQTKLIAFNAALEASSSGEAGARFAVVASEIRRFADNVVESVLEIKEKISELQEASKLLISEANNGSRAIDTSYKRMVEQKEVFENIVEVSQNVATRSQQISNLSKQQELASAQIFSALKEISAGVKQFVTATASTSATADNLNNMSIELKETLAKYKTAKKE